MPFDYAINPLEFVCQTVLQPAKKLVPVELPEELSTWANYIGHMQATIYILAAIIAVVTLIASVIGITFTAVGYLAQRRAEEEVKGFRAETRDEVARFRSEMRSEAAQRHDMNKSDIQVELASMRKEAFALMDQSIERVDRMYSAEIVQRLEKIEASYASNLRSIEQIMITFQDECIRILPDSIKTFDFLRFNTFRHLLMRLISGGRDDTNSGLARLTEEYAPNIGQSTATFLRALISTLQETGRITRSDQRILADRLINVIDSRFAPILDDDATDQN